MNKKDILIVAALPQESQGRFEQLNYPVLYTGVGKINATYTLTSVLSKFPPNKPKVILNLGTAGSFQHKPKQVIQISHVYQADMLCEPLASKYCTPYEDNSFYIQLKFYSSQLLSGSCGTSDRFITTKENFFWDVFDMEAYALAKVCNNFMIPFISLKAVSDSGKKSDWKENLNDCSKLLLSEASKVISDLKPFL